MDPDNILNNQISKKSNELESLGKYMNRTTQLQDMTTNVGTTTQRDTQIT